MTAVRLSQRALHTDEQPISFFMKHAMENPHLVSPFGEVVGNTHVPANVPANPGSAPLRAA